MANRLPKTYQTRVRCKTALSALTECKRVALCPLPTDFFIHFLSRIAKEIKTNPTFVDILSQYHTSYWDKTHFAQAAQDAVDTIVELFKDELEVQNIDNVDIIAENYKTYLLTYRWPINQIYWLAKDM